MTGAEQSAPEPVELVQSHWFKPMHLPPFLQVGLQGLNAKLLVELRPSMETKSEYVVPATNA